VLRPVPLSVLVVALPGLVFGVARALDVHVEVAPAARLTRRVLFVVDRSGSMQGGGFTHALGAVRDVLRQPSDDLEVGLLAFNQSTARWPGIPEGGARPVPPGWAALPSEDAVDRASAWLDSLGAGGDTLVGPPLAEALAEPRGDLSIVLVSDGLFARERTGTLLELVERAQAARVRRGLGRAVLACYGLGDAQGVLARLGEAGGGGYVREDLPPVDEALGTIRPAPMPSNLQLR
jgi:Mg-chelatase subunit ChlD